MSVKRGCSVVARDGMGASEARSEEGSFGKAGVCICWTPSSSSGDVVRRSGLFSV